MPLRIRQTIVSQLLQRGHIDSAAVGRPGRLTGVIVQDEENVRSRGLGCLWWSVRSPVFFGIADVKLDDSLKRFYRHFQFHLFYSFPGPGFYG